MDDDAVDLALPGKGRIGGGLLGGRHDRQDHVVPGRGIDLARAEQEIGEDRIDHLVLAEGHDMTDRHRPAGGEAAGGLIRGVAVAGGGLDHAGARRGANFGIAVQRAADRGGRKPEAAGEFLEGHRRSPIIRSVLD